MTDAETACTACGRDLQQKARFCSQCGAPVMAPEFEGASTPHRLQMALGDDYEVMGELGRGGFAVVYSVRDKHRQRYLALKVMRRELMVSTVVVERFRREAKYVADLDHANILTVSFAAERSDLVYYAMPRIHGQPLSKLLKVENVLGISVACRILRDICMGLLHAHERGVIHRDIKPSNVMIENNGRALILDFGIAKALSEHGGTLSISGEIIGTPEYMSPEQALGVKKIDHRTDIYSWAVVAFRILAGTPPFTGDTSQAILSRHLAEAPPNLTVLRPDVPDVLAAIINKCLAKEASDRPRDMHDVDETLRSVLQS